MDFCGLHSRRCQDPDCTKLAAKSSNYCDAHQVRCSITSCTRAGRSCTKLCSVHGVGTSCDNKDCGVCGKQIIEPLRNLQERARCLSMGCSAIAELSNGFCALHG